MKQKNHISVRLLNLALALCLATVVAGCRSGQEVPHDVKGTVVKVLDGDSLLLSAAGDSLEVRLHGIDAPEYRQPHGEQSRSALGELVEHESVAFEQIDIDDYGRRVGVVYRDGMNVNEEMVRRGHAWWYEYYAPDRTALERAQEEARQNGRGLWRAGDPVPPWQWRRTH